MTLILCHPTADVSVSDVTIAVSGSQASRSGSIAGPLRSSAYHASTSSLAWTAGDDFIYEVALKGEASAARSMLEAPGGHIWSQARDRVRRAVQCTLRLK